MDVIITAGGIPRPDEPLYPVTQGGPKAMLEIAGKPMIQWIIEAAVASDLVDRIVLVGLPLNDRIRSDKPVDCVDDQGEMVANIQAGAREVLRVNPAARQAILLSSDIPAITTGMVEWFIRTIQDTDHDLYYTVIPKAVMETRYPNSRRSYTRMKDGEYCGGDVIGLRPQVMLQSSPLSVKLTAARKSSLHQAALLGFDTLILLLLHQVSLQQAEKIASKRLGIRGIVIVSPYAELGMDVDKPHQLDLLRADLAGRITS